jgi:mannose-6-phosphate isomerase-like protein (cupin superfamily)
MPNLIDLSRLDATADGTPVLPDVAFATPWRRLDLVALGPGQMLAPPADPACETGYVLLAGRAALSGQESEVELEAPALLRCAPGQPHRVRQAGAAEARLLHLQVGSAHAIPPAKPGPAVFAEPVDRTRLQWRPAIHGGVGRVATRHIWGPGDFGSCWTFADHAVLDAGGSVGYHYHEALEECFVVLGGRAQITVDGRTFSAGPGHATWQGIGQVHGVYNPHREEFAFLRLAVRQAGRTYTTVDVPRDLAAAPPEA